ncbi:hypothetical protein C8R43DRAFT_943434 [Mycena crocata]|nr:hypothetical protein C8R43DRAFT_943434 [Mycena crocata]
MRQFAAFSPGPYTGSAVTTSWSIYYAPDVRVRDEYALYCHPNGNNTRLAIGRQNQTSGELVSVQSGPANLQPAVGEGFRSTSAYRATETEQTILAWTTGAVVDVSELLPQRASEICTNPRDVACMDGEIRMCSGLERFECVASGLELPVRKFLLGVPRDNVGIVVREREGGPVPVLGKAERGELGEKLEVETRSNDARRQKWSERRHMSIEHMS